MQHTSGASAPRDHFALSATNPASDRFQRVAPGGAQPFISLLRRRGTFPRFSGGLTPAKHEDLAM
jgi:hypothetical protein